MKRELLSGRKRSPGFVDDWRQRALAEIGTVTMGQSPPGLSYNMSGLGMPLIQGNADIRGRRTVDRVWTTSPTKRIRAGDVVLTVRAPVGYTGLATGDACLGRGVCGVSAGNSTPFLFHSLVFRESAWTNLEQGSTFTSVNSTQVRTFEINWPDDEKERLTIAGVLDDADDLTNSLEQLIAKKRNIKQGMMQGLLTGRKRLPGFTSGWRESTIGTLAQVVGGGTPSTRISTYWGGGIPWFTPAEIRKVGSGLVSRSERTITKEGMASSSAHLLPAGSVLVTSRASVGNCAIAACPLATNQGFASMIPRDGRSTWFLYYWTQQNRYELISRAAGSTFLEISASRVSEIPLLEPELDEQAAIGTAIRDIDLELDALTKRLELVRYIKQGMMQELLTGRTRLPVVEVAV